MAKMIKMYAVQRNMVGQTVILGSTPTFVEKDGSVEVDEEQYSKYVDERVWSGLSHKARLLKTAQEAKAAREEAVKTEDDQDVITLRGDNELIDAALSLMEPEDVAFFQEKQKIGKVSDMTSQQVRDLVVMVFEMIKMKEEDSEDVGKKPIDKKSK